MNEGIMPEAIVPVGNHLVLITKDEIYTHRRSQAKEIPYNAHLEARTQEAHSLEQASLDH